MEDRILQLEQKVEDLEKIIRLLGQAASIPNDIGNAMSTRILKGAMTQNSSSKTAASETINILGSNAAKPMLGFILLSFKGQSFVIPHY